MSRVKDKIALVTGGSRGIGKATVEKLAKEGAKMVISCDALLAEYSLPNVRHEILNVTDREAVKILIDKVEAEFGRIDILVNNAGITRDALISKMDEKQWDEVIDVNLKGVFNVTQAVSEVMIKNGEGSIITLSSIVGINGNIGQTNYAASKAGVIGMTKSWAKELTRKGAKIRANCIAPGFILTPMTENLPEKIIEGAIARIPLGRTGKPEDIANAVLFLASDESSFISGQVIPVTGGA